MFYDRASRPFVFVNERLFYAIMSTEKCERNEINCYTVWQTILRNIIINIYWYRYNIISKSHRGTWANFEFDFLEKRKQYTKVYTIQKKVYTTFFGWKIVHIFSSERIVYHIFPYYLRTNSLWSVAPKFSTHPLYISSRTEYAYTNYSVSNKYYKLTVLRRKTCDKNK